MLAKFSRLNGISVSDAISFFEKFQCYDQFDALITRRLSRLFDEPLRTIRTIDRSLYYFEGIPKNIQYRHYSNVISYCPLCLKKGYHASFHDFFILNKCPIHKISLERSAFSHSYTKGVNHLADLLNDATNNSWLKIKGNLFLQNELSKPLLRILLKWVGEAKIYCERVERNNVFSLNDDTIYSPQAVSELVNRMACAVPPDRKLQSIFSFDIRNIKPTVSYYSCNVVKQFLSIFPCKAYFDDFSFFYKELMIANGSSFPAADYVLMEINNLSMEFSEYKWAWGFSGSLWSGKWLQVNPEGWPMWAIMSPLDYTIENLKYKWAGAEVASEINSRRKDARITYRNLGVDFTNDGLVRHRGESMVDKTPYEIPKFDVTIDSDLLKLIEDVQLNEAKADVALYRYWLKKTPPASVNLPAFEQISPGGLILDENNAYLQVWPIEL